jgi:hypothetical protein
MLYEELSRRFGCQVVEPFKEPVVIVDSKDFRKEWEEQLKSEGCKILVSDYLGRTCFLIRKPNSNVDRSLINMPKEEEKPNVVVTSDNTPKPKTNVGSPEPTSSQPTPQPSQPQNIEEAITELIREGLGFKEIQQRLGLTHAQLMGYMSSLRKKGVLNGIGWIPQRKRKASTREAKNEPAEPSLNTSNLPLREMLEASLKLLDSHPKVVRFLLQKCMESLP